jgi:DNA-binding Lrp family transcriptional regulator
MSSCDPEKEQAVYALDEIDIEILRALQTDGRMPVTQLSNQLGVPHTTVRDRIRKMEEAGVLQRYVALIDATEIGLTVCGYAMLTLDQRVETSLAIETLRSIPEVTEVYLLTGDVDALVKIWARDIQHLSKILYQKFNRIPGLVRMSTALVLNEAVKPERLPLDVVQPE